MSVETVGCLQLATASCVSKIQALQQAASQSTSRNPANPPRWLILKRLVHGHVRPGFAAFSAGFQRHRMVSCTALLFVHSAA